MKRLLCILIPLFAIFAFSGCTNINGASKTSSSLTSFLGFSELPDWYIRNQYRYADSQWIKNDFGLQMHYRDLGDGPVIVLLHGEISSLHTWEKWIDTLSENFRVIALDLPGSGLTGAPHCVDDERDTCPENLSEDYIKHSLSYFLDDLELDSFSLIGSSYGGYLATQYALKHPHKVDKLVLISPMGFQQELPWILNYLTTSGLDFFSSYIQPSSVISTIVDDLYGERDNIKTNNLERYIRLAQSDGGHKSNIIMLKMVRQLMEHGTISNFGDIDSETLVMWGELDTWGDYSHAQRWSDELANAQLARYPFLGHIPMEENAEHTLPDIVAFLNGDPLPSIEGLGAGGTFTIQDAVDGLDKESLFGAPNPQSETEQEEFMTDDTGL